MVAQGQVVNTERLRFSIESQHAWKGRFSLSSAAIKNTRMILDFNINANVAHKHQKHAWYLFLFWRWMQINRQKIISSGYQHLRHTWEWHKILQPEWFLQLQQNAIWLIKNRFLSGLGFRLAWIHKDSIGWYMGIHYMYEYEELTDDTTFHRDHRISSNMRFYWQPHPLLVFSAIIYFQPRIDAFYDYRISLEGDLQIKLSKHFRYFTRYQLNYDTYPPIGLPTTFYTLTSGISYEF